MNIILITKKVLVFFIYAVFNTDNNHSVTQTYNFTTYKNCDYNNALDNDTMQWVSADPSSTSIFPVTVAVPLLKVGPTYFFSSDYDGEQCENGQHFKINVTYGQGLPRDLKDPSDDDSMAPISPISGDEESAPDTIVPSSFDHPRDVSTDDSPEPSNSISLSMFSKVLGIQLNWVFVMLALVFGICWLYNFNFIFFGFTISFCSRLVCKQSYICIYVCIIVQRFFYRSK